MKVLAINGSPRKNGNTATLLNRALEGAASKGVETELVHLYDLEFKGCVSCFSCKLIGGESYGKCAHRDDLTPILEKIQEVDALILGSPVYMRGASGEMRSFLERLLYPYPVFDPKFSSDFQKLMPTGFVYTMGAPEQYARNAHFEEHFKPTEQFLQWAFGSSETMYVFDTDQFDDYSKYIKAPGVDPKDKARRRREEFPNDLEKAFDMGARLAGAALERGRHIL